MTSPTPGLRQWIWKAFARSALIPLVLVEMVLIIIYLLTNAAIRDMQVDYLRKVALEELQQAARQEARTIDVQLAHVGTLTETYRNLVTGALSDPLLVDTRLPALTRTPDGVLYTPEDTGGSAVFYSAVTPAQQQDTDKIRRMHTLDPLMRELVQRNPLVASVYMNTWDSYNHIYPWFNTPQQYPHDMAIPEYNFYYLADAQHNPQRGVRWTDVYLDPAGHGWMMSAVAPVYRGDFLEGVVGLDIQVSAMLGHITSMNVPWSGYAMLVSDQLNIMALPQQGEQDFGLDELTEHSYEDAVRQELFKPEDFNLHKRTDTRDLALRMQGQEQGVSAGILHGRPVLIAWATVPQTGWRLLTVVAERAVFSEAESIAERFRGIGYILIAGLVLFYAGFFAYMWLRARWLSESLLRPISGVNTMMAEIGRGHWEPERPAVTIRELDDMVEHAARMGRQLQLGDMQRRQIQERLELVIDSATEALWEFDTRIGQLSLRGRFCQRFGMTSPVMSVQEFLRRVHPEDCDYVQALLDAGNESMLREASFRFRDGAGAHHWLLARGRVLEQEPETGRALLIAGTQVDIGVLKQTEAELRHAVVEAQAASVAKSRFISSMSHELRTPLNIIHGFAQLMQVEGRGVDAQQARYLEEILLASQHLTQLVGDILDWASIQAERPRMELVPVSVATILRECAELVSLQMEAAGLQFELDLPEPDLLVQADTRRLRQVLLNLLSNAIKYNRPHGWVRLGWRQSGQQVVLQVEDGGLGIRPELQPLLFEPFQRIGRENTAIQGTGIGLALCLEFAQLMKGRMGLQSEPGVGSCFWIELPLVCSAQSLPVAPSSGDAVVRIACVGGSPDEQLMVRRVLQNLAEVVMFSNGVQALDELQQTPVDLLLLDFDPSSPEGEVLLRGLRETPQAHALPVIVLSAVEEVERISTIGCQCLLRKPVNPEELHSLVAALLHEKISNAR